ncbi:MULTISPECIES: response regulator transcription factor [unclassified Paenibacillus]|uniref:response regulator transcription factor n=1 Tax=unclassified Paenibacillus TaxID=185978 RepID=UPI001C0F7BEC|nr:MULTISPECIES: response regulator transcription factor [unclassified Paenibacillus]MBU5445075.1 response regulator transcription factor [Paenibacillus sp. MSJ-34]CAH0119019.1 Sensor histidine kinase RcsC [Paenibacillus sp. CECT 9249]
MLTITEKDTIQRIAGQLMSDMIAQSEMPWGAVAFQRALKGGTITEADIAAIDPHLAIRQLHDMQSGISLLILEGQTLSDTHFFSILLKERLEQLGVVHGTILAAGSGDAPERTVTGMLQELEKLAGKGDDILIYNKRAETASAVLVVDNDKTIGEYLSTRLGMKGYEVHVAQDGQTGLEMFEDILPEMVITELALPVMDGYQLISNIRRKNQGKSKVMILTEKKLEHDIRKCFDLGVSDFLAKPFSPIELEARIRRLLDQAL